VGTGATSLLDQAKEKKMRRVMLMLAAVAMMVSLFAVVAYAAEIQGSENKDLLTESNRGDTIKALAGDDRICAGPNANECVAGYSKEQTPGGFGDRDRVHGNKGDDVIDLRDGDGKDTGWGGSGTADVCLGDELSVNGGDKFFGCETVNGQPVNP
jgi:Ca2+-binding RTX toxin-like protein